MKKLFLALVMMSVMILACSKEVTKPQGITVVENVVAPNIPQPQRAPPVPEVPTPTVEEVLPTPELPIAMEQKNVATVELTSTGFNPALLTVAKGTTVTFVNKDSRSWWPASDNHPTHTNYPGSDIDKCGGPDESVILDACKGLKTEESWSFTFDEVGKWNMHDHIRSSKSMRVVVE